MVAVAVTFGVLLGSGRAESASVDLTVKTALEAQGLQVSSVAQDSATNTLNVVITSKAGGSPEDAWAHTIVAREADFLAQSGGLVSDWVSVTVLDEQGTMTYRWSGPVSSRPRPLQKTTSPTALDGLRPDLAGEAEKQGVVLQDLSISSDQSQGTVVKARATVTSPAGDVRDTQLKWATLELLGSLRDYAEGPSSLGVDLYGISVMDAGGAPLVEYVVDPNAKTVRAWMAPGITPVWALGRPSPGPSAKAEEAGS